MTNNKLIAKFMGAVGTPKYNPTEWDVYITGCLDVDSDDEKAQHFYTPDEMKYHTSWDWLMPVVQKIESLGYVFTIQGGKAEYGEMISETRCFIAEDKLSSTYQAVVEFINEHNKYICGACGDHVNEVVFNEDVDVDECTNCI